MLPTAAVPNAVVGLSSFLESCGKAALDGAEIAALSAALVRGC